MQRLAYFIATAGGAGHVPVGPGTAGSLIAAVLFFGLGRFGWTFQVFMTLVVCAAGLWASHKVEKETGGHDNQAIVIDEVAGMWITLCAFPPTFGWVLLGFICFRALDILKPFPSNYIDQRWPGASGVMFDDVMSGIYAHAVLRLVERFWGLL